MVLHLPDTLPTLTTVTGRYVLSPFEARDVGPLARLLAHDEVWSQGYGDGGPRPTTREETVRHIHRRYDGLPVFAIRRMGPRGGTLFAGTTGITGASAHRDRVRVGRTVIHPALWGTGANHEVKIAVFDWLFAAGAGGIECDVDPRNVRSLKSLAALGFAVDGFRRTPVPHADRPWRDMAVLGLSRAEWPRFRERAVRGLHDLPTAQGAPA